MRVVARLILLVSVAAAACGGGNSTTGPSQQTLAGTWNATRAEFVSASNSSLRTEVVALGTAIVLTFDAAGTYTLRTTAPGTAPETETGTWSASSDVLTLRATGQMGESQFNLTLSGNTLVLSGGHRLFDINNDNVDEETILSMTLTRQ